MLLRIVDGWYTTEDEGYRQTMPVVHLIGRDTSWYRHHVCIEGFRPYFLVTHSEYIEYAEDLASDDRVLDVKTEDERGRPEKGIDGEQLYRIVCREPGDVGQLRELFDDPFEADVLYPVRFLIDHDIYQWVEVPDDTAEREIISADEVSIGIDETPDETPPPRVCTYDIEVKQGGRGPPVVSEDGTEQARNPITAITAHDSYTDEYEMWVLAHDDWDADDSETAREAVDCDVSVYKNPRNVAGMFCEYVADRGMDVLTGWSASGFDHPYLVNYCLRNDISSVYGLSPTNDVYEMSGDGSWINSSLKGRLLADLMDMYEKTLIHEPDSKRLEDVAVEEDVSVGKLAIDDEISVPEDESAIDWAWQYHPDVFTQYSLRDVKAAVGINRESKEEVHIL